MFCGGFAGSNVVNWMFTRLRTVALLTSASHYYILLCNLRGLTAWSRLLSDYERRVTPIYHTDYSHSLCITYKYTPLHVSIFIIHNSQFTYGFISYSFRFVLIWIRHSIGLGVYRVFSSLFLLQFGQSNQTVE